MAEKIYVNGLFIKKKPTQFGEIVSVSINVGTLIEELKKHENMKGYVNLTFFDRKEADKNGNNMYAVLDTYEPKPYNIQCNVATGLKGDMAQQFNESQADDLNLPF